MYEALVADSARCILHDKPFLQPLFQLLAYHQGAPVNFEADELVSQLLQVSTYYLILSKSQSFIGEL